MSMNNIQNQDYCQIINHQKSAVLPCGRGCQDQLIGSQNGWRISKKKAEERKVSWRALGDLAGIASDLKNFRKCKNASTLTSTYGMPGIRWWGTPNKRCISPKAINPRGTKIHFVTLRLIKHLHITTANKSSNSSNITVISWWWRLRNAAAHSYTTEINMFSSTCYLCIAKLLIKCKHYNHKGMFKIKH